MSEDSSTGVGALARMLVRIGQGSELGVAQLAAEEGVARATAFDVVRRLSDAKMAGEHAINSLGPGTAAITMAFAVCGLTPLRGAAEALLALLHEETGARVELVAQGAVLVGFGAAQAGIDLVAPITDLKGNVRAQLRLGWPDDLAGEERQTMTAQVERVRLSLCHYLVSGGTIS
ncbi:MAG TPA: hypothetical protein VL133_01390 [Devosia sp.]|nr:hypothetical protein [Devosia sp.]